MIHLHADNHIHTHKYPDDIPTVAEAKKKQVNQGMGAGKMMYEVEQSLPVAYRVQPMESWEYQLGAGYKKKQGTAVRNVGGMRMNALMDV